jgi:hypothetical protein
MSALLGALVLMPAASNAGSSPGSLGRVAPASLFVAPTGADTNRCTKAAPCSTFDRAYRAAKPGDVVEVAAGDYPNQVITAVAGRVGPNVLFRPATDARVVLAGLEFGREQNPAFGPGFVTVRDMTLVNKKVGPAPQNQAGIFIGPGSRYITLENMDAGSVQTWFADRVTIRGGDYGPCYAISGDSNVCGNTKFDVSTNITVEGALFHDYRFDNTCFADGADCHWECMYLNGGINITIRNSRFRDCAVFDLFVTISGPDAANLGHRNLTIENNWFDTPWAESTSGGSRSMPYGVSLAWCQNSPHGYRNVRIRFNSFQRSATLQHDPNPNCIFENVSIVGNLMMWTGCDARYTYSHNVWSTSWRRGKCSPSDRIGASTFPYANTESGQGFNFRLTNKRKTLADNLVPRSVSGGCPRIDFDRQRRPLNKRCDAGADERLWPRPTARRR